KAAILYRARQLDLITESQYKTGVITLRKYGETQGEKEDHLIAPEPPELLEKSLRVLLEKKNLGFSELARKLEVQPKFIQEVTGLSMREA
ncbi:hypothetical protein, partial [Streptomyces sp. P17]|uniref:hypothetical protein n=1 Tax=Streptomyces sp. P17 TaxID=3074716 RepID=UPI0028F419EE